MKSLFAITSASAAIFSTLFTGAVGQIRQTPYGLLQRDEFNWGFKTIVSLLDRYPAIRDALNTTEPTTFIAPTDQALQTVDSAILNDAALLESILRYHVIPGSVIQSSSYHIKPTLYEKLDGNGLNKLNVTGKTQPVVFDFVRQSAALSGAGKVTFRGMFSCYSGNCVIQVATGLLFPPKAPSQTAESAGLTYFLDFLTTARLKETVDGLAGVTIFAPNNTAFLALLQKLNGVQPPNNVTIPLLTFHVVPSILYSNNLTSSQGQIFSLPTLNGANLTVNVRNDSLEVLGPSNARAARIQTADILIDNGVIHVIDDILLPFNIFGGTSNNNNPNLNNGTNTNNTLTNNTMTNNTFTNNTLTNNTRTNTTSDNRTNHAFITNNPADFAITYLFGAFIAIVLLLI
ncbi:hypothetical protein HK102_000346 [Quaeritorhiza haematococci]|nr:hypothetical protein HK102_000346 [Quaeritorhiza haematococci]